MCGTYAHGGSTACSIHSINESVLIKLVSEQIRAHAALTELNEEKVIEALIIAQSNETQVYHAVYKNELEARRKEIAKLDLLIESLYADKVNGIVSVEMFKRQVMKHEQERASRQKAVTALEQKIASIKLNTDDASNRLRLVRDCASFETLTPEILFTLIDKIIISETQIIDDKRVCDVKIVYNYSGEKQN
jgi:hypothetical protein